MKISVITSRYGLSGVPLAQLRFARALSKYNHKVDYIIGHINDDNIVPETDNVNIVVFNKVRVIGILFPLITYLKKEKPDVIFTAGDHLNVIVALAVILSGLNIKISASSRVTPYDTYSNKFFSKRWVLKQLMRLVMDKIDVLTCVSKDMVVQYNEIFNNPSHVCVYNIIKDGVSQKRMVEDVKDEPFVSNNEIVIVAAGMLEPWKGFKDLILAINEVIKRRKVKLVILGEGSMREELETLISDLNLTSYIQLKGHVLNPLKYFKNSDVFVLSSYVEGLPNVLIEAMMCGCTPVSTDCPTGPREVLQNGKYGYLVPVNDPIAMAKGIENAIEKPIDKDLLDEAIEPFSEELVIQKHFDLLNIKNNII